MYWLYSNLHIKLKRNILRLWLWKKVQGLVLFASKDSNKKKSLKNFHVVTFSTGAAWRNGWRNLLSVLFVDVIWGNDKNDFLFNYIVFTFNISIFQTNSILYFDIKCSKNTKERTQSWIIKFTLLMFNYQNKENRKNSFLSTI